MKPRRKALVASFGALGVGGAGRSGAGAVLWGNGMGYQGTQERSEEQ